MKTIAFNGVITTISSKSDRSLRLSIVTPELSSKERALFMEYQSVNSDITLEPLEEKSIDRVSVKAQKDEKSMSGRLRNVIFALWASKKDAGEYIDEDFQVFYKKKVESFINNIKEELEQYD